MRLTRSSKRKLMREENNDKTSKKSKLPNNERSQKRKKESKMFINIPREENQDNSSEESKRRQPIPTERERQYMKYLKGKEIAESALCEYNNRHGTDLELVRFLEANHMHMFGPGCRLDFADGPARWRHLNIEARRRSVDTDDENSLFLFVESICSPTNTYDLLTLLLVAPTDKLRNDDTITSTILKKFIHAGVLQLRSVASDPKLLSEDDAVKLSQLALKDYNENHLPPVIYTPPFYFMLKKKKNQGTNLKFVRAFKCNSFTCAGRLMDFTEKSTRWVHVNFEAMVGVGSWESIRLMFAELYLGNDDKYVLATLLPAEPEDREDREDPEETKWRDGYPASECAICPDEICHPWRGYRYCFSIPPRRLACPMP
ncbi:UDP-XYL synthase 6 [Striga asiatica]|uniref:UDP-XYL synthase 6 n=1 Tax=Striga asiatica TaxID=4170 RepID=A0A5A7PQ65_STRAF|nr:UDP-XYL synthase 6 [Striga asiatica]